MKTQYFQVCACLLELCRDRHLLRVICGLNSANRLVRYYLGLRVPLHSPPPAPWNVMHNSRLAEPGSRPYWVLRINDDKATLCDCFGMLFRLTRLQAGRREFDSKRGLEFSTYSPNPCEHGNKPLDSMKFGGFREQLRRVAFQESPRTYRMRLGIGDQ
jgi:hypothetical protein